MLLLGYQFHLLHAFILSFAPVLVELAPPTDFSTFLLSGMNLSVKPCDDFYNFVCGTYNESTLGTQLSNQHLKHILDDVKADTHYPKISNSLISYTEDCAAMLMSSTDGDDSGYFGSLNKTFDKDSMVNEYINSFGYVPIGNATPPYRYNHFDGFIKMLFDSPVFPVLEGISSAEKRLKVYGIGASAWYAYDKQHNELIIAPTVVDAYDKKSYRMGFRYLKKLQQVSKTHIEKRMKANDTFFDMFAQIINNNVKAGLKLQTFSPADGLPSLNFSQALYKVPFLLDVPINWHSLLVKVDLKTMDELDVLFSTNPVDAQNMFIALAVGVLPQAVFMKLTLLGKDVCIECFCLSYILAMPAGAISKIKLSPIAFNLYLADLMLRREHPSTDDKVVEFLHGMWENLVTAAKKRIDRTKWISSALVDGQMNATGTELLDDMRFIAGFPEYIEAEQESISSSLDTFRQFKSDDSFVAKAIRVRKNNLWLGDNLNDAIDPTLLLINGFMEYQASILPFHNANTLYLKQIQKLLVHC